VPRLVAFGVDAALALTAAVVLQLALRSGGWPFVHPAVAAAGDLLRVPSTWALALVLAAGRDVPFGASFGKWLLCLRLAEPAGGRLGLPLRLLRAPVSALPLERLAGERRASVPWRVIGYTPGRAGFVLRFALALVAAGWSLAWGVASVRPSIGRTDAVLLVDRTLARDPLLRHKLGEPLRFDITAVTPRSRTGLGGERGEFAVRIRGTARRQAMMVHAVKVEGHWVIDEVVDIHEMRLASSSQPDTLVAR
jgi:hypothetical protein